LYENLAHSNAKQKNLVLLFRTVCMVTTRINICEQQ
jgi:hypothetical protein